MAVSADTEKSPSLGGQALWLFPAQPQMGLLRGIVDKLAGHLGTPRFEPHVTLVGRTSLNFEDTRAETRELVGSLEPLSVRMAGFGMGAGYFRALFLSVALTPELWGAHERASRRLAPERPIAFVPHLSLAYGDLDLERRAQALRGLEAEELQSLQWPAGLELRLDRLGLVSLEGPPESWQAVESWELGSSE